MQLRWTVVTLALGCGAVHEPSGASRVNHRSDAGSSSDAGGVDPWSIVTLPAVLDPGNFSVMVDGNGTPHVAYGVWQNSSTELWHAWVGDGRVQSEQVDGSGRGWRRAWVPGSQEPRLVYDHPDYGLGGSFHALRTSTGGWDVEKLLVSED
jgi:hypothetical protein